MLDVTDSGTCAPRRCLQEYRFPDAGIGAGYPVNAKA